MADLYLISTPIGNRLDITIRALKKLFSVDMLACEDTRTTGLLLSFYQNEFKDILGEVSRPRLISYHEHNADQRANELISYLEKDKSVGLVSDAGTPTISDPGYNLVKECIRKGVKIVSLPGANAAITALSMSGYSSDKFTFLGFLPRKHGKQNKIWEDIKNSSLSQTVVFYESPFRLIKVLGNIKEVFGDIEVCVARELTKIYEEVKTAKISEWEQEYEVKKVKGEIVVIFRK